MAKKFNITGLCVPEEHYMADVSKKLEQTRVMVEAGEYFIINRPRQYGKTTTLYSLADVLIQSGDYIVFNTSFEGIGDAIFNDEKTFSHGFIKILARHAQVSAPFLVDWLRESVSKIDNLDAVSDIITDLVSKTDKRVVLMIDEVDKSSNNQLFISFLAMLRNKYLQRRSFKTFHAIVLAGVHDVKSLKQKMRPESEQKYNSPWNIAAEFTVDMNLYPSEIKPMLADYVAETGVKMDTQSIANHLFYYTSGYPFLVSKLCKMVDEQFMPQKGVKEWTNEDIDDAVQKLLFENNTNFDTLAKYLENDPDLYRLVYRVAIDGEQVGFNSFDPITNLAVLYGILVNKNNFFAIHNRIYQEVIVDYMVSRISHNEWTNKFEAGISYKNLDKSLNMEAVLERFQAFMREQYSKKDRDFLERNSRLVFLAFLKPIINGSGYDFKEAQISEERRLDVVVTYLQFRYIIELKIWRGAVAHEEGLLQLTNYLDRLALTEGYLIIFDHAKRKSWKKGWTEAHGKKVFTVWV